MRWFATLQDCNLRIKHVPGKLHHDAAPSMLSKRPDADKGEDGNQNMTLLPPELFIRLAEGALEEQEEWVTLEQQVGQSQQRFLPILQEWKDQNSIQQKPSLTTSELKLWYLQG